MFFPSSEGSALGLLIQTLPQVGNLTWIGIRPARSAPLQTVDTVVALTEQGLAGDHYSGKAGSKRQVTLIQAEHIMTVASMLHRRELDPGLLRRNLVVQGINLLALKDRQFWVGEVLLEMTGLCHPCSRMETNLGPGGYNAMRGHGGITARILQGGRLNLGDAVKIQV
ncbi:MOSC domain-containing protein [Adhaeribacter arboris]|uniref:MOSC domain-containing protein n=1 Tax=Adhaeribacter arboris TaxID=2072846 RepID=A0A2T2YIR9_9BACT|nr:MOSC domain-containing protein [Adhaeribacter arboris]PSR55389.1 MOSC domain-containing protein [Adhaeribacter arboris]